MKEKENEFTQLRDSFTELESSVDLLKSKLNEKDDEIMKLQSLIETLNDAVLNKSSECDSRLSKVSLMSKLSWQILHL